MIYVFLILVGLALGSFVNALVWRLHEQTKKNTKLTQQELSIIRGRSLCPYCGHQLAVRDLVPVLSWLSLLGRCRYCKEAISRQYPAVELLMTVLLVVSYVSWPLRYDGTLFFVYFSMWSLLLTIMLALTIYDMKWMILPTKLVRVAMGISMVFVGLLITQDNDYSILLSSAIGAVGLGGLFWLIYQLSDGKWIGGGDVRLGIAIGLFLGWQKTPLSLTLAAYIGTVIVIIALVLGKYTPRMKLPFGPLLIAGWYLSFLWGQHMVDWYLNTLKY